MAKITKQQIYAAAKKCNLDLTDDQIETLEKGNKIDFKEIEKRILPTGKCEGIKIVDLGNGCGLYIAFPPAIYVCCEF